jgi:hypothetical protein
MLCVLMMHRIQCNPGSSWFAACLLEVSRKLMFADAAILVAVSDAICALNLQPSLAFLDALQKVHFGTSIVPSLRLGLHGLCEPNK